MVKKHEKNEKLAVVGAPSEKSRLKRAMAEIKEAEASFEMLMKLKDELKSSYKEIFDSIKE